MAADANAGPQTQGNHDAVSLGYDFDASSASLRNYLGIHAWRFGVVATNAPHQCIPCGSAVAPQSNHVQLPPLGPNLNRQPFNITIPRRL